MRDGTRLVLDVYRPDATGRYPVLYACSLHNKDIQGPDITDVLPPQPAHAPLWFGPIEAGNTRHFIANGYVHVIAQPRGSAKSEGVYGHEETDHYDLIEWITRQSWCDGNVGMVGISGYAGEQWRAAAQGHPALKAIFPYDACSAYGGMFGFRDFVPGACCIPFLICWTSSAPFMSRATGPRSFRSSKRSFGARRCTTRTSSNTSISTTS
jgi:putative CocE/NonD family hydrolase